jgi:hypothetical protein
MKQKLLAIITFFSLLNVAKAQHTDRCGTMQYLNQLIQDDPSLVQRMEQQEQQLQTQIANKNGNQTQAVVTIPVVVHVVYNTAAQNISDDMIKSQIDVLNEDFSATNSDKIKVPPYFKHLIGNPEIQFKLASRDPQGNATNGIVRVSTTTSSFSTNNGVKSAATGGSNAWATTQYLNIWVCNMSGGILGYAQFPGTGSAATDGVVITYQSMGRVSSGTPYNLGRTATHEIGHWLNLRHIWGDATCGNDMVNDTPVQNTANYGCPCQKTSCTNAPFGEMYMNYMDYVDDACMQMFTIGQATRMNATLNGTRAALKTSLGLTPPSLFAVDAGISNVVNPFLSPCVNTNNAFTPEVVLNNYGATTLTSCTINYKVDNGTVQTFAWSGSLASNASVNVTLGSITATTGDKYLYCYTTNPNGGIDNNTANDRLSRRLTIKAANAAMPIVQSFSAATFPPSQWTNKRYDCNTGWGRNTSAYFSAPASMYFNNFAQTAANAKRVYDLYTQPINLSTQPNPTLSFNVAYAQRNTTTQDTLEVLISTDCGYTYTTIYKKWGTTLETAAATTIAFVPTSAQWRNEVIDLTPYATATNAMLIFRNTTKAGNNVYIDDITIDQLQGIDVNVVSDLVTIYPNPGTGIFHINMPTQQHQSFVTVVSALGETVIQKFAIEPGMNSTSVDITKFGNGIYFITIESESGKVVKKISLNK